MKSTIKIPIHSVVAGLAVVVSIMPLQAYETETHAAMSFAAYQGAEISKFNLVPSPLERYGLNDLHNLRGSGAEVKDIFGSRYFDFVAAVVHDRFADSPGFNPSGYEGRRFRDIGMSPLLLTQGGWIARGAIREDDLSNAPRGKEIPQDDWCGNELGEVPNVCTRVLNHFFDPYNNTAFITPLSGFVAVKAPNWAIGTTDAFVNVPAENISRTNQYSLFDAREAMYRALTLRRRGAIGGHVDIFSVGSGTDAERGDVQRGYWATTFRALGNVIHLVQDMAQPQHTRGDQHGSYDFDKGIFGHQSFYEQYVNGRIVESRMFTGRDDRRIEVSPLNLNSDYYKSYPIPRFNSVTDYFSTARGSAPRAQSLTGGGLADYSSRGFYSAGTNIGSAAGANYPQPPQLVAASDFVEFPTLPDLAGNPIGPIKLYLGGVQDSLVPALSETDVPLSSRGPFDQFLEVRGKDQVFTINHYNADAMASLLLPRAIAYSTGVIDYFFRGKLKLGMPPESVYAVADTNGYVGFTKLKVFVQNVTSSIVTTEDTYPQSTGSSGTLVAVLRYRLNTCLQFPTLEGAPEYDPANPSVPKVTGTNCGRSPSMRDLNGPGLPNITVSEEVHLSDAVQFPAGGIDAASVGVVFQFSNPLPFNASDVELQVIYRGPLGAESDGIAVGFDQLSEPTFRDVHNCQAADCQGSNCTGQADISLPFNTAGATTVSFRVTGLPPARFARAAFLTRATAKVEPVSGKIFQPMNNQDFGADQHITEGPNGELLDPEEIWPAGVKQTGLLFPIRKWGTRTMLTWPDGSGDCKDYQCYADAVPQCSPLADPEPFPLQVLFLANP